MKKNFWKKTAAGLLALLIVAGTSPVMPFSQVFERSAITASANDLSGECGENATWTLTKNNDGDDTYTLTISGTGAMTDYAFGTTPWYSDRLKITRVTVEEGITTIGDYAFRGFNKLLSADIPNGVTSIGNSAFYGCNFMNSISIPSSVSSIGIEAFRECFALTSVIIPEGVKIIGDNAFFECNQLSFVCIPSTVTSVGDLSFKNCGQLTTVEIHRTTPPALVYEAFDYEVVRLYVPSASVEAYKNVYRAASDWLEPDFIFGMDSVNLPAVTGGTATADKLYFSPLAEDRTVTLTVTPAEGYSFGSVSVKDTDNEDVELTDYHDGTYSFTMPAKDVTVSATFMQNVIPVYREVKLTFDSNGGSGSMDPIESLEGTAITLPECGFTAPEGKVFKCWSIGGVEYNAGTSFNMKKNNAKAIWQNVPVTYLDENGVEQTITDYTVLTGDEAANSDSIIELSGGTYVVNSDINYSGDAIYSIRFTSDTTLILCDGKTMKVKLNQTGNGYGITCRGNLTICGQSGGTGKLDVYAYSIPIDANNITINGGNISAQSVYYSAISSNDSVMLNGGTVNATGGQFGTYDGVEALGGDIILGGAEVTANSYRVNNSGAVKVKEGLIYEDESGNIYTGTLTDAEKTAIANKTLAPVKPQSLSSGTIASQPVLHIGNSDNILAVQNTYLDGYKFDGFMVGETPCEDMAAVVEAVRNLRTANPNAEITITPKFTQKEQKYDLTIVGGTLRDSTENTGEFKASDQLYAVANAPEAGQKFSHWKVGDTIVGYETTYAFRMPSKAMTLTAVYVPDDTDVVKEGVGYIERVYKPENGKMSFVSILSIPDGCQMLKAGIVAQKSEVLGTDELTENNARFVRYSDTSANSYSSFKYTWTLTASDDSEWTVRPYLVYTDAQGEHTVYGAAETNKLSDFE